MPIYHMPLSTAALAAHATRVTLAVAQALDADIGRLELEGSTRTRGHITISLALGLTLTPNLRQKLNRSAGPSQSLTLTAAPLNLR